MLPRGQIFYDASCGLCTSSYRRFGAMTERRGFKWIPLQEPRARALLNLEGDELPNELKLFTRKGRLLGGADALLYVAKYLWWARPLWLIAFLPGVRPLLRVIYRWVAKRRHAISDACGFDASAPRAAPATEPAAPPRRNVA